MTSPDLIRELQGTRPAASPSLRARVREISAPETVRVPRFRLRLPRRPALVLLPAAAVLAVAVGTAGIVGLTDSGRSDQTTVAEQAERLPEDTPAPSLPNLPSSATPSGDSTLQGTPRAVGAPGQGGVPQSLATIGPEKGRAERVEATLTVKVKDSDAVSRAAQDALDVTRSLGGHVLSASVATGEEGSATLTLRIPVDKTQEAIMRLSSLGTIVSQQVSIQDLQENLDALLRRTRSVRAQIVRITARLESESLTAETRAALELRRRNLRTELRALRQNTASTNAEARFATIQLGVVTPDALGVTPVPSRLDRTLDKALAVLVWEGVIALAVILVAAPFAILAAGAWLLRYLYRKREDERLLAAS